MPETDSIGPIEVVDYHAAGEPFRIVTGGGPDLEGGTVLDRRDHAQGHADAVRRFLVDEPRGRAGMCGGFVTPPDDDDGDLGVVFFHRDGFSTACGHGTIALVTWAVESGAVAAPTSPIPVVVDTPSGRLVTRAEIDADGAVAAVTITNVPSYVSGWRIPVQLDSGVIGVDIAYGGAYYATVNAADLGLPIAGSSLSRFVGLAKELRTVLADNPAVIHPSDDRLSGLHGTIFFEDVSESDAGLHQRNVTVFADGEIDRSPCGSATSARLAVLDSSARLRRGATLEHESVIGTYFTGKVVGDAEVAGVHAVTTEVRGSAFRTAETRFILDAADPLGLGFHLG